MSNIEINYVRKAYQQWRSEKRREVPMELRRMVLELCKQHGDKVVVGELGVSSATLWCWRRRMKSFSRNVRKDGVKLARVVAKGKPVKFVEIKPVFQTANVLSGIRVEWQRSDGHRMKVDGVSIDQLSVLARKFLGELGGDR